MSLTVRIQGRTMSEERLVRLIQKALRELPRRELFIPRTRGRVVLEPIPIGAAMTQTADLLRFQEPADELFELRAEEGASAMPTLAGHFAVFDSWTEINSAFEGRFLERIAPGAFDKTFKENRSNMRVLFNHGKDPTIGEMVLGPIRELRAEERGAYYEVPLMDGTPPMLVDGLRNGLYGASFRFRVIQEDFDHRAEESEHNPEGLPERTIKEARVMEFGPVTFPAYEGATAGLRSATDWWRAHDLMSQFEALRDGAAALAVEASENFTVTPESSRRTRDQRDYLKSRKPRKSWELPERGHK